MRKSVNRNAESTLDASASSRPTSFPKLPRAPLLSSIRKARIRAALFQNAQPVMVGRFVVVKPLGRGNMGEIYVAYDELLNRDVAVKLVSQSTEVTEAAEDLLRREAQALARVSHPNVVQVYEVGMHEGRIFIAMELIRGRSLTSWLDGAKQLPRSQRQREILAKFIAAGRGLEAAHAAGVAHRDFKPDNVVVGDDGRVRVVDFGLARALVEPAPTPREPAPTPLCKRCSSDGPPDRGTECVHDETARMYDTRKEVDPSAATHGMRRGAMAPAGLAPVSRSGSPPEQIHRDFPVSPTRFTAATRLTQTGTVRGTPRYMAPEQKQGTVADHRSDQFSFCVALGHALYGVFPSASSMRHPPLEAARSTSGLSECVRKAIHRGLSHDPSARFASMGELLAALAPKTRRRHTWVAAALLMCVALLIPYMRQSSTVSPCAGMAEGAGSLWSAEYQAIIKVAFLRSDLPYAESAWSGTKQRIDRYAHSWKLEAVQACRATLVDGVQSDNQFDHRMLCLERARRQVSALLNELANGTPQAVQHAVEAAESLPDLQMCGYTEGILFGVVPPPPWIARAVAAARERLALARALEWLGRTDESLVICRETLLASESLRYPPLRAEILVGIAGAMDGTLTADTRAEAQRMYFEALDIAEAERHDQLSVEIWNRLVLLATRMDPGMEQAHAWWRRNAAAVHRAGDSKLALAKLHHMRAAIYYRESKYAESVTAEREAIRVIASTPDQEMELSSYYGSLARSLTSQGLVQEALPLHEYAITKAIAAVGVSHPRVIKLQMNYGKALEKSGQLARARLVLQSALELMPARYRERHVDAGKLHALLSDLSYVEGSLDEAEAHGRASLRIYERAGAPESLRAEAFKNLGNVDMRRKKFASALRLYETALKLRRLHLGSDHYQIAVNEGSIAEALVRLGRHDEAAPHINEALRILAAGSVHSPSVDAWIGTVHGEVLLGSGRPGEAIPVLEQALARFGTSPSKLNNHPRALWALARALHSLRRDESRVRQLAERARALFSELGALESDSRDAVARFLAKLAYRHSP